MTLEVADDYLQQFTALLETLPLDKIHIKSEQGEDEVLGSILRQHHKQDFVPKEDLLKALGDAD